MLINEDFLFTDLHHCPQQHNHDNTTELPLHHVKVVKVNTKIFSYRTAQKNLRTQS